MPATKATPPRPANVDSLEACQHVYKPEKSIHSGWNAFSQAALANVGEGGGDGVIGRYGGGGGGGSGLGGGGDQYGGSDEGGSTLEIAM